MSFGDHCGFRNSCKSFVVIILIVITGNRGCVGLCLYNKMNGIKDSNSASEPKKSEVKVLFEKIFAIILVFL